MTEEEAKEILSIYRHDPENDLIPEVTEALRMAASDPKLAAFLKEESILNDSLSKSLSAIQPPQDLKDKILIRNEPLPAKTSKVSRLFPPAFFAAAAAIVILLALTVTFWAPPQGGVPENLNPDVATALRVHLASNPTMFGASSAQLTAFIKDHGGMVPTELPDGIAWDDAIACDVVSTDGGNISLVCFHKNNTTFHLYTFPKSAFPEIVAHSKPTFTLVNDSCCASWSTENSIQFVFAKSSPENMQNALEI